MLPALPLAKTGTKVMPLSQGNNFMVWSILQALCQDQASVEPNALPISFPPLQVSPNESLAGESLSQALLPENLTQVNGPHYAHFTDEKTGAQRG